MESSPPPRTGVGNEGAAGSGVRWWAGGGLFLWGTAWIGSAQQVGNLHLHRAGRAVLFTGHAVPALIEGHIGFLGGRVDRQQVHGADVDTDGAALVGDALVFIDGDRRVAAKENFLGLEGHGTVSSFLG